MAGEWPLVGRDRELGRLTGAAISGESKGVVLAGPAGVGKTRLAAECLAEVQRAGLPTARVAATRAAVDLPFGALAPLLPTVDAASTDPADFLRRCCSALRERAAGRRLVLLVDDAHLLDDASAVLLHQLTTTASCFVLATLRTGAVVPESVVALWKDGHLARLDLAGLGPQAIEQLVRAVLEGPVARGAHVPGRDHRPPGLRAHHVRPDGGGRGAHFTAGPAGAGPHLGGGGPQRRSRPRSRRPIGRRHRRHGDRARRPPSPGRGTAHHRDARPCGHALPGADHRRPAPRGRGAGSFGTRSGHHRRIGRPALSAITARVALSAGELDVARLAAAGRTNPDIAAQLHLSRRTVENYLYRAYEKLGISTRDELAAALEP